MKKNSRRAVFYDVLTQQPKSRKAPRLGIPSWWRRSPAGPTASPYPVDVPPVREAHRDADGTAPSEPGVRICDGHVVITLNTVGAIVVGVGLCVLLLATFSLGRRSAREALDAPPTEFAANDSVTTPGDPLLASLAEAREGAEVGGSPPDDLNRLLQPPSVAADRRDAAMVRPTQPPALGELQYLCVQSMTTRTKEAQAAAVQDALDIYDFLLQQGVATDVRTTDNGVFVFSRAGFAKGRAAADDRAAFQRRMEHLGQLYRKRGGRYAFQGCYYRQLTGNPVER